MKIVFICSSLWPGRDGVGDYCRRLSVELIKQGHGAGMIALQERDIAMVVSGTQHLDGVDLPVLQIPEGMQEKDAMVVGREWVNELNPDWLSLQFVPFGYHPKGLRIGFSKFLLTLGGNRPWHIMFHELWVGMAVEESKKLIWWGRAQRRLIKSLVNNLYPRVMHTQTQLYVSLLQKLGFAAAYLPLFGNIPVSEVAAPRTSSTNQISFVVFGTIHSGAPIAQFARDAARYSQENNITVKLIFVGRCGGEQERWLAVWETTGLPVEVMGELDAGAVSGILKNATMGLSATAIAVIEKSGSFAAMRDHGLPVISVSKPWQPIGMPKMPIAAGIIEYREGNFEACITGKIDMPGPVDISAVAAELVQSLSAVS